MGAFGGFFITNKGRALQAKAQTGVVLHYNRIALGDGSLTSGQQIAEMTGMVSQKMTLAITKLRPLPGGQATVGTSYNNNDIATGFYLREIGVFAQDPDEGEILYCYANAGTNAEYISAGGGPDTLEKYIDVVTIVGNAVNVTATINESLVFVTVQDFDAKLNGATGHKHTGAVGDGPKIDSTGLNAGAATDVVIGNRTIDDTVTAAIGADTPTRLWSKLANMVKRITGKSNWYTAPATTLEAANTHINRTDNPHGVTAAQVGALGVNSIAKAATSVVVQDTRSVNAAPNSYVTGTYHELKTGSVIGLGVEAWVEVNTTRSWSDDSVGFTFQKALGLTTGRSYVRTGSTTTWGTWQMIPTDAIIIPASINLNNYQTEGDYFCPSNATAQTLVNRASDQAFHMKVSRHAGVNQTVTEYFTAGYNIYTRNFYDPTWGPWNKVWHSGNDGAGSGLDADLLDGQHGSFYMPASSPSGRFSWIATGGGRISIDNGGNNAQVFYADQAGIASQFVPILSFPVTGSSGNLTSSANAFNGTFIDLSKFSVYIDRQLFEGKQVFLDVIADCTPGTGAQINLWSDGIWGSGAQVNFSAAGGMSRYRTGNISGFVSGIFDRNASIAFAVNGGGTIFINSARLLVL